MRNKKNEYEPDPDRFCEASKIVGISKDKSEIKKCDSLADYRVLLASDKESIIEDGDASNPKHWKHELRAEYYCLIHFGQKYRNPHIKHTPKMTFKRIERP